MPRINTLIESSSLELVRDRIGQILSEELANQKVLANSADPQTDESRLIASEIPSTVFVERFRPIEASEQMVISVNLGSFPSGDTQIVDFQNAEAVYYVVLQSKAKSVISDGTIEQYADQVAAFKLHRMFRLCRSILMNEEYNKLGFDDLDNPVIGWRMVTNLRVSPPYNETRADALNHYTGIFEVRVKITEQTPEYQTITLNQYRTQMGIGNGNILEFTTQT